jgi:hypothetical protein
MIADTNAAIRIITINKTQIAGPLRREQGYRKTLGSIFLNTLQILRPNHHKRVAAG